jgi:hypothetical protein
MLSSARDVSASISSTPASGEIEPGPYLSCPALSWRKFQYPKPAYIVLSALPTELIPISVLLIAPAARLVKQKYFVDGAPSKAKNDMLLDVEMPH